MQTKNSPEFLTHNANLETIYKIGNSINGPITNAMEISSCPGNELIAIASAKGELRAKVVMVRLAYSEYVKLIFSHSNKSRMTFVAKKRISGMKIAITEFKFVNSKFPWLEKIQNTASAKKQISKFPNKSTTLLFKFVFNVYFVIWEAMNGIAMTIISE